MLSLLVGIRVPHNPIINDERDRKKGSLQKYSGDLKSVLVWILNGQKEVGNPAVVAWG